MQCKYSVFFSGYVSFNKKKGRINISFMFYSQAVELEHKRLRSIADNIRVEFPIRDPRLQHIVTYMMHCNCCSELLLIMLLEQFAEIRLEENEK